MPDRFYARSDAGADCADRAIDLSVARIRSITMKHALACLFALVSILVGSDALAGCTVSPGTADLGARSSFVVATTSVTTQSTTGFKCTGGVLSILSTNTIDATLVASANAQGTTPR